ncbi:hypothetical protein C1645_747252 [Glomus cerebriforme]|uniref:Uncharacterized protein n=1 Tax=Glomus cerebriforme TaxID=658196 RepID=A0A397TN70_9GLOM|nr:hypothetical protein C1645_747252 [Glomus cerebriforme]
MPHFQITGLIEGKVELLILINQIFLLKFLNFYLNIYIRPRLIYPNKKLRTFFKF